HNETSLQVAAGYKFLDEQARHNGLASSRVVSQQESKRLARQHRLVHSRDLVRQRIDQRRMDGQNRDEEVSKPYTVRLGDEPELRAITIEAPGSADRDHFERRLAIAEQDLAGKLAARVLVGQL